MKKLIILLVVLMLTTFAHAETNPWSLEGTFVDADKNYLGIFASDDPAEPGWYVGGELGEDMFGAVIQQEGDALHGDVGQENGAFIVTVAVEGDGVRLTLEDGTTHHLSKWEGTETAAIVTIEADGMGQIAIAEGDEALAFDDESLVRGAVLELVEPSDYTFAAKADEGYRFVKWTKNGETFSSDAQIALALTESADYVAVFRAYNPYAGEPVSDIDSARTVGDVLALSNGSYTASESLYVTVAELDDVVYRVEAAMDAVTSKTLLALDFEDPDYLQKLTQLVSSLPITRIENLTEQIPSCEALDALIGKTYEELLNDGWTCEGWTFEGRELNELVFHLNHGPFAYDVTFDGTEDLPDDFDEADLKPLTVTSVTYSGIGDATAIKTSEKKPCEDEMASEQAD